MKFKDLRLDGQAMKDFHDYCYRSSVRPYRGTVDGGPKDVLPEMLAAYKLAIRLESAEFANLAIERAARASQKYGGIRLRLRHINQVYDCTEDGHELRNFIIDLYTYNYDPETMALNQNNISRFPPQFTVDLLRTFGMMAALHIRPTDPTTEPEVYFRKEMTMDLTNDDDGNAENHESHTPKEVISIDSDEDQEMDLGNEQEGLVAREAQQDDQVVEDRGFSDGSVTPGRHGLFMTPFRRQSF